MCQYANYGHLQIILLAYWHIIKLAYWIAISHTLLS